MALECALTGTSCVTGTAKMGVTVFAGPIYWSYIYVDGNRCGLICSSLIEHG